MVQGEVREKGRQGIARDVDGLDAADLALN